MQISEEKRQRSLQAVEALKALRDEYTDVLIVLDYVTLSDIAKHEIDSDDGARADDVLPDADLEGILWRLGKHANSAQTSLDLLPALIQYAIDEHERRGEIQP
jgi:hypothetical protein